MSSPYIGQIIIFAGTFAIRNWAMCNGQLQSIAQNTALFALLGTTYGGNGQTTFALPDLRGRVPVHAGQGPGLSSYSLGQMSGSESVTLTANEMPAHTHTAALRGSSSPANSGAPSGSVPAGTGRSNIYQTGAADVNLGASAATVASAGGSQPHTNMQPYLAVNYEIAIFGIFPPRS